MHIILESRKLFFINYSIKQRICMWVCEGTESRLDSPWSDWWVNSVAFFPHFQPSTTSSVDVTTIKHSWQSLLTTIYDELCLTCGGLSMRAMKGCEQCPILKSQKHNAELWLHLRRKNYLYPPTSHSCSHLSIHLWQYKLFFSCLCHGNKYQVNCWYYFGNRMLF